jgi:putative transposase
MALRGDATIELSGEERAGLEKVTRSRRTPQAVAQRARIVLMTSAGMGPADVGSQLGAALDVANGQVISRVRTQQRHQECLGFLRQIDKHIPPELDLHLIMDNYVTHKHTKVKAWLARNPRVHLHFTPTYSSRLNQVERWFTLITERAIRRNSFAIVRQLKQQIELFVQRYNADASPFQWVATADSILQKVERTAKRISATGH